MENYGEQYERITYPDEDKKPVYVSEEISQFVSKEIHEQIVKERPCD